MKYIFGLFFTFCFGVFLYMLRLGTANHVLRHQVSAVGNSQTKRIFFISDTHNRKISPKLIRQLKEKIDFVIIGGDFADQRTSTDKIEYNLQQLTKIAPTYFVWGNNDEEVGSAKLHHLFEKYGVTVVANDSVLLQNDVNKIRLCAVVFDDTPQKFDDAFKRCESDEHIIFVAHNPQDFVHSSGDVKPLLQMGGHFHGGQIRLGRYSVYPQGSFRHKDGMYTLISNGYGTTLIPLRFGAPVQTHIVELNFTN